MLAVKLERVYPFPLGIAQHSEAQHSENYPLSYCKHLKEEKDGVRLSCFLHGVVMPPLTYYKVMFSFFQPLMQ